MVSCLPLSCFIASPDCAKAERETAKKAIAIKLPNVLFINVLLVDFPGAVRTCRFSVSRARANEMWIESEGYKRNRSRALGKRVATHAATHRLRQLAAIPFNPAA